MKISLDPRVHTAMVSDSLDDLGIRNNVMDGKIRPLQMSMRAVGTAATIKFVPDSEYDKNDP
jgi:4-hydroxy-4-methyl-2-oxoglutarate aldolase